MASQKEGVGAEILEGREMTDIFSEEVPELLKDHLSHLQKSAISIEVIRERGYQSVLGKTPLKNAGFGKAQQRAPGILIPIHGVDGFTIGHQYRPDKPRLNSKEKPIKYENPAGSSVWLDVPPRCQPHLGNPNIPLWITEGVKKVDALATAGACAITLTGVWGFKGKNLQGGITILADFDYIAFNDRLVYLAFDSDSTSNPQVMKALKRLSGHIRRKRAKVRIIKIPAGSEGEKVGVDDYLAQGHTIDDLVGLEVAEEAVEATLREKSHDVYCISAGILCWVKQTQLGPVEVPLCNFTARIVEDILKDDGYELVRFYKITGQHGSGQPLPTIDVPEVNFNSLNWVGKGWGSDAIITAGQTYKDRLREAIQLHSRENKVKRFIYTHTGWREVNGQLTFLTASGALGMPEVDVEIERTLQRYSLPDPIEDPSEAIRASLEFLEVGEAEVTLPLWSAMYMAPLSEILPPAFTLWLVGPTGTFKSTVVALALCHFGEFTLHTLPASWRDTVNSLEKRLALAKDIPLVIDDWAPAQDMSKAREYEYKAEQVARAQANRLGRGRLRSDTSTRPTYIPRGMLISTGEQLPSGQSHTARLLSVEVEPGDIDKNKLTEAQKKARIYPTAMTHYILWLKDKWPELQKEFRGVWEGWRDLTQEQSTHPKMPETVAWLYAGLDLAMSFAEEKRGIGHNEAQEYRQLGWEIFQKLVISQSGRIEEERPGQRFIESLTSLIDQGRVIFRRKDEEEPRKVSPGEIAIGWKDDEGYYLLNPQAAYGAVHEFCQRSGQPFTFKANAVWKDLRRLDYIVCQNGRTGNVDWIYGKARRVIKLKEGCLSES